MTITIQQLIDDILSTIPGAPFADTVDTIKTGSGDEPVRGVATTFMATIDVLWKAAAAGCNFIITHEPTFFNHRDETGWIEQDAVFTAKKKLIEERGLTIWRFHDYWHSAVPDGIVAGLTQALGWEAYEDPRGSGVYNLPPMPLGELVHLLKGRLEVKDMRVVGPAEMTCRRVGAVVGAYYGERHIELMSRLGVDTVVCGEVSEWQVYEYTRDSNAAGIPRALIVAGHERSEEPGMAYLADWLKARHPGLAVTHIPAGDPLTIR